MKYKANQERIDFVTQIDIDKICVQLSIKFGSGAFSEVVSWGLSKGYRTGIERGLQMSQEVDVYIEHGTESEK